MKQCTVARTVNFNGIGLHSGKDVQIVIKPAKENTGIVFRRTDLGQEVLIKACASNVTTTVRATTICQDGINVFTVEHLLACLHMMGINNCLVEMSSPEPPVADGSSLEFTKLIQTAGKVEQTATRKVIKITKPLAVYLEDKYICILPYDGYRISFTSINPHRLLGTQYFDIELNEQTFLQEIAPARTVGFVHEFEMLKKMGLGLGGSLDNVVVYDDENLLNELRFSDELVRHKILDVIGDLSLAGHLEGHIIAVKSGHALNTQLAQKICEQYKTI